MDYELKLIDDASGKIEITDPKIIQSVEFKIYQDAEKSTARSSRIYSHIEIKGKISHENAQEETMKLFEWSKEVTSNDKIYKHMTLRVRKGDDVVRVYELDRVFCISYLEEFKESDNDDFDGNFTLILTQKEGSAEKIGISCK